MALLHSDPQKRWVGTPPTERLIAGKGAPDRVQRSRCGVGTQADYTILAPPNGEGSVLVKA